MPRPINQVKTRKFPGNKSAERAYCGIQGDLTYYVNDKRIVNWPVSYIPGLNLNNKPPIKQWDIDNIMNTYEKFPYFCDYPKPLLPPTKLPRTVFHDGDPATDIITSKKCILEEAEKVSAHYAKQEKDFTTKSQNILTNNNNADDDNIPKFIADIASVLEMDSDQFFKGQHYNYYYTGGSLNSINLNNDNKILLFQFGNDLVASPLKNNNNSLWKLNLKNSTKSSINDGGIIFEIRHKIDSTSCRILSRLKNQSCIYTMIEKNNKIKLYQVTSTKKTSVPLISADLDPFNINKSCIINMNGKLRIWDIVKNKLKTYLTSEIENDNDNESENENENNVIGDNWRLVRYHNKQQNILTLTDRCCLKYIDLRSHCQKPVLTMCPNNYTEVCDDVISFELPSVKNDNIHYIATYHNLMMMDSRNNKFSVQQKWTHQMESAPLFGNTRILNNHEVITLSSQKIGDSVLIINTWENNDYSHGYSLPYSPLNILDTLRESHHHGKCLDPLLKKRLELTTAGTQLINDDSQNLYYLVQNSVGDVFYQCITHKNKLEKESFINCQAYYALEMWEKQMLSNRQGIVPLVLSDQVDMKNLYDNFTNKTLIYKNNSSNNNKNPTPLWKQKISKLEKYTDLLGELLLDVWNVKDNKNDNENIDPHEKNAIDKKVMDWIDCTNNINEQQDIIVKEVDDDFIMEPINSQELVSVSQQPPRDQQAQCRNDNDDDNNIFYSDQLIDYQVKIKKNTTKKPQKKKKKNLTDGFC
ncbi:hypothetical protein HCN44_009025 [Aphidius gifuensis]|uniref:Uncharacterized protein n=1 Tax=Aphidius gifuensis TaxID=684658 RepID=A0A834XQZ9_APHGI|nr:uncharacterized protein LOC122858500 [Aphidius gifuensis]KAF7990082.1 hypothetical protein HCN44_009025 [Aphidius gifuensis]